MFSILLLGVNYLFTRLKLNFYDLSQKTDTCLELFYDYEFQLLQSLDYFLAYLYSFPKVLKHRSLLEM